MMESHIIHRHIHGRPKIAAIKIADVVKGRATGEALFLSFSCIGYEELVVCDRVESRNQIRSETALDYIGRTASFEARLYEFFVLMNGQEQNVRSGSAASQRSGYVKATGVTQRNIEDEDVGLDVCAFPKDGLAIVE
jgi:hypothetical protein